MAETCDSILILPFPWLHQHPSQVFCVPCLKLLQLFFLFSHCDTHLNLLDFLHSNVLCICVTQLPMCTSCLTGPSILLEHCLMKKESSSTSSPLRLQSRMYLSRQHISSCTSEMSLPCLNSVAHIHIIDPPFNPPVLHRARATWARVDS